MARNVERDARESERRRRRILDAGFELFSTHGIEAVSLQAVADAADVGIATVYNYYQNKVNLVIAISADIWGKVWNSSLVAMGEENLRKLNAYQLIEVYDNVIIKLYKEQPKVLCFSGNYKTYICREGASLDNLKVQLDVLEPLGQLFFDKFEEAKEDGSIRSDISKPELYTTLTLTMLGMAERYAQGIVWADDHVEDHTKELMYLKEMILDWVSKK